MAANVEPLFNVALVDVAALALGTDDVAQHHAAHARQLRADLGVDAGIQRTADEP